MTEGKPLYVGEKKKPRNLRDIRSFRDAMEDPENCARRGVVNGVVRREERR